MNCLLGFVILAARDKEPDFSWVVPVVFVAIWIIGGIGKFLNAAREDRQQRQKQTPASDQSERKMRYKPIPDVSATQLRQRTIPQVAPVQRVREPMPVAVPIAAKAEPKRPGAVASLKKAMHDAMEEAYAQQAKTQMAKPVAARTKAVRAPQRSHRPVAGKVTPVSRKKIKEPQREIQPQRQEETVLSGLLQKENIRKAIIYSEIIGKPLALRDA